MANITAGDIIDKAYKKIGIDSPDPAQDTLGLDALNNLLASWSAEGLLLPFITRETFTLTVGDAEYSIGSGADFDTTRPIRIENAFLRDGTTDYPLTVSPLKDHNAIIDKTIESLPTRIFYLPELANGKILFDREPDKAYILHLDSWKALTEFAATTTTITSINIPNEYKRALIFNLAIELSSDEDYQLSQDVFFVARDSKEVITDLNAIFRIPEEVDFDSTLLFNGRYDIVTDERR